MNNENLEIYNEGQKLEFIRYYTQSVNTKNVITNIFKAVAPFEEKWQADLCTRSAEELQPVIDQVTGLQSRSQFMPLSVLKEYVKWCISMEVPGACDGMLRITAASLSKVRLQMVASPLHLQKYLDDVFNAEDEKMVDNLYRCYYWLAYGGIHDEDVMSIKASDVDFKEMCIRYKGASVPIYREALPAFHNAVELTGFQYKHPNYGKIERERVPGDKLIRSFRELKGLENFRTNMTHFAAKAFRQGKTELRLSFYRVWMSGLFYRMYECERAGYGEEVFTSIVHEAIKSLISSKYVVIDSPSKEKRRHEQRVKDCLEDYYRWKMAFSIQHPEPFVLDDTEKKEKHPQENKPKRPRGRPRKNP